MPLPVTRRASAYKPGDLVTWMVGARGNLPHIGIVTDKNLARRAVDRAQHRRRSALEDILFRYRITGHYRYFPSPNTAPLKTGWHRGRNCHRLAPVGGRRAFDGGTEQDRSRSRGAGRVVSVSTIIANDDFELALAA